jgi:hypothetical protein
MSGEPEPDKGVVETSTIPPSSSGSNDVSTDLASHNIQQEPLEDYHSRSHASSISNHDEEKHDHYDAERNDPAPEPLHRVSTELGPAVTVPRLKRRGLLGQFALVAEVENPKTYPRKMKWFITFIVAVAGAAAPLGSSIFFRKLFCRCQYSSCPALMKLLQHRSLK